MVSHGVRLDAEFVTLVSVAFLLSFYISGRLVSNALFSALIVALFFLMGLHLDRDKFRRNLHHRKELGLGLFLVYLGVPLIALGLASLVGGGLADALIALGASTAAIGSPMVFSNIGRGEGGTALAVSTTSVLVGIVMVPVMSRMLGAGFPLEEFAIKNMALIGLPLLMGVSVQRFENQVLEDMRIHFSKLAVWLLALIFGVQLKLAIGTYALGVPELLMGVPVLTAFVVLSYLLGHASARALDIPERKARALGFVAGSKGIAVAIFIASQISAGAVVFVSMYYFVRQVLMGGLAEAYSTHLQTGLMARAIPDRLKDWAV